MIKRQKYLKMTGFRRAKKLVGRYRTVWQTTLMSGTQQPNVPNEVSKGKRKESCAKKSKNSRLLRKIKACRNVCSENV